MVQVVPGRRLLGAGCVDRVGGRTGRARPAAPDRPPGTRLAGQKDGGAVPGPDGCHMNWHESASLMRSNRGDDTSAPFNRQINKSQACPCCPTGFEYPRSGNRHKWFIKPQRTRGIPKPVPEYSSDQILGDLQITEQDQPIVAGEGAFQQGAVGIPQGHTRLRDGLGRHDRIDGQGQHPFAIENRSEADLEGDVSQGGQGEDLGEIVCFLSRGKLPVPR